ncbi:MAG: hypothetical protein E7231_07725 [Cellulosilyticum sp.]|nr:hypothetical protein [Cellulosilyticum sp.]
MDTNHIAYEVIGVGQEKLDSGGCIEIENPYPIKIRTDKIAAEIFHITREQIKRLEKEGIIILEKRYLGSQTKIFMSHAPSNETLEFGK